MNILDDVGVSKLSVNFHSEVNYKGKEYCCCVWANFLFKCIFLSDSSGPQRSKRYEGTEDYSVWIWGLPEGPFHHSDRGKGQILLHFCLCKMALQHSRKRGIWHCMVNAKLLDMPTKCKTFRHAIGRDTFYVSYMYTVQWKCPRRKTVKDTIIQKFAGPYDRGEYSPSVQKTLYDTQLLVLDRIPQVSQTDFSFVWFVLVQKLLTFVTTAYTKG